MSIYSDQQEKERERKKEEMQAKGYVFKVFPNGASGWVLPKAAQTETRRQNFDLLEDLSPHLEQLKTELSEVSEKLDRNHSILIKLKHRLLKIESSVGLLDPETLNAVHQDFLKLTHDAEMYQAHLSRNRSCKQKRKTKREGEKMIEDSIRRDEAFLKLYDQAICRINLIGIKTREEFEERMTQYKKKISNVKDRNRWDNLVINSDAIWTRLQMFIRRHPHSWVRYSLIVGKKKAKEFALAHKRLLNRKTSFRKPK